MPALVILALWTALLGPGTVRWLRQHRPTTSIASFHRQLRGFEHSGPRLAAAGFGSGDARWIDRDSHTQRREPERPKLVLLKTGATEKESNMHDGRYDDGYVDPWVDHDAAPQERWDDPWSQPLDDRSFDDPRSDPPTRSFRTVRSPQAADFRAERGHGGHGAHAFTKDGAQARRTRIVVGLSGAIVGTFLLGLIPDLTILWSLTVLSVVGLASYLGLMYYASNVGLYHSRHSTATPGTTRRTPVARAVMPALLHEDAYAFDDDLDDEDWRDERIAAAR